MSSLWVCCSSFVRAILERKVVEIASAEEGAKWRRDLMLDDFVYSASRISSHRPPLKWRDPDH